MPKQKDSFDFSTLLASCAHDMKNSLGMVLNGLDEYLDSHSEMTSTDFDQLSQLRYEARRVNSNLVELLSIYKLNRNQYSIQIEEHSVNDFLDEIAAEYRYLLSAKRINLELICDEDLIWFFDRGLISSAIGNIVVNSSRYANRRLRVLAKHTEQGLVIEITDDGKGYPQHILDALDDFKSGINPQTGSTGLGLYFARLAATNHSNGDTKGTILLDNDPATGGGRFSLTLP